MINFIKAHKYSLQFLLLFFVLMVCEVVGDIKEHSYIEQTITLGFDIILDFILVAITYMDDRKKDKK